MEKIFYQKARICGERREGVQDRGVACALEARIPSGPSEGLERVISAMKA